ncbi:hypothetical protein QTP88_027575 [Uroleucon formosanum]
MYVNKVMCIPKCITPFYIHHYCGLRNNENPLGPDVGATGSHWRSNNIYAHKSRGRSPARLLGGDDMKAIVIWGPPGAFIQIVFYTFYTGEILFEVSTNRHARLAEKYDLPSGPPMRALGTLLDEGLLHQFGLNRDRRKSRTIRGLCNGIRRLPMTVIMHIRLHLETSFHIPFPAKRRRQLPPPPPRTTTTTGRKKKKLSKIRKRPSSLTSMSCRDERGHAPRDRKYHFRDEFSLTWSFIKKGRDELEAYCTLCKSYFKVYHGGKSDIVDHIKCNKHNKNSQSVNISEQLIRFCVTPDTKEEKLVAAAELVNVYKVIFHHSSFNSLDCTTPLYSKLFPDSKIACKMSTARTKGTAIVKHILAPHTVDIFKSDLENTIFFSLATDASNHKSEKIFPIIIQYFTKLDGIKTSAQFNNDVAAHQVLFDRTPVQSGPDCDFNSETLPTNCIASMQLRVLL